MEDKTAGRPGPLRVSAPELEQIDDDLLEYDRPSWAWEFLRRNAIFCTALKDQGSFKRQTRSNITTIEASTCAPEVRKYGICFR